MGSFCNHLGEVMEGQLRPWTQMSSPLAGVWKEDASWLCTGVRAHLVVLSPHMTLVTLSLSPGISLAAVSLCAGIFWGIPGTPVFYSVFVQKPLCLIALNIVFL